MYTLQIDVQSTNPLDGTTPLDINAPGVTVDKTTDRTIIVTLDGTLVPNFGRLDPGQVAESQIPRLAGKVLMLVGFSAIADGQPFPAVGNTLDRVTPRQGAQEGIETLANLGDAAVQGMVFGTPELFPLAHLIALTTTIAGPTRLIFVLAELTDDAVVKLGCCGGAGTPLVVNDEGLPVDLNTTLLNFTGAGVAATPAGPPGFVNVTIPGAGLAVELDMSLDPTGIPLNQAPFRFIDMPPIIAQLGLLPLMSSGDPVANRLWFGRVPVAALTPGLYDVSNTDIRGGDPESTVLFNTRGQTEMNSGLDSVVQLLNPKRVVDLWIDAGPPGNGGPFFKTNRRGIYLENITTTGPANGVPGNPPFVDINEGLGARWVVDRCQFGNPGIEARGIGLTSFIVVEDDCLFGALSLQGTGSMIMEVRGTGNTFDPFMGDGLASLDIDIGHSSLVSPPWSGAESINFGCGPLDLGVTPGTFLLFPGGGDPTSPAPVPIAGPDFPSEVAYKDGILRGINLLAGTPIGAPGSPITVDVYLAGILVYTETLALLGGLGSFASTTFGFMSSGLAPRPIAIAITGAAGSFAYLNVGVLIK